VHSFLSVGRLHLPVSGLFAAAGLVAAMLLGLRTSRMARVDPNGFWDAGMLAVFGAFLLSRALGVLENLRIFLAYPGLALELPSLSAGGLLLTAVGVVVYLKHRDISLLGAMDAAAPCAALLAGCLELGWACYGTRDGMPTRVPWAVASEYGRVHPVEIYSAMAWVGVCGWLLLTLGRGLRAGETAARGFAVGGLVLFAMDFFRLPQEMYGTAWLDGIEWRAMGLMLAGGAMLVWRAGTGRGEAIALAERGTGDAV